MQYPLRTLLIVLALGPLLIAWYSPAVYELGWYLPSGLVKSWPTSGDGTLTHNGKTYGPVRLGDRVVVRSGDRIFINGKRRLPDND